jgi:CBS domain-containing protein
MSSPVRTVHPRASVRCVREALVQDNISSVAVTTRFRRLLGVISRTDLLDAAIHPADLAQDIMSRDVATVRPFSTVLAASALMAERRIHRVFVAELGRLLGVLSCTDVVRAVSAGRNPEPIETSMSSPVLTIQADESVKDAVDRLEEARVHALVVSSGTRPVGTFSQRDALREQGVEPSTRVEDAMDPCMVCLDRNVPVHRAARLAAVGGIEQILVVHRREVVGIVTGTDFLRVGSTVERCVT